MHVSSVIHHDWKPFPLEWGRLWRGENLLSDVGAISDLLLFRDGVVFGSVGLAGRSSGACGSGSVDVGLAGGFEFSEDLLDEGGGVLVRALAFHGCGDVGPEVGVVGVFDVFLCDEEVLFLLVGSWLAGLRFVRMGLRDVDGRVNVHRHPSCASCLP